MPNTRRILLEGCCYHLIVRGNQKQPVFKEPEDHAFYLHLLKKQKRRHKFYLYAYCLMPNHVHLLGEIKPATHLSRFMHDLNRTYTLYFNHKYNEVGHLWQGRFKHKLIYKDTYLIDCINYIERNPLRASLVNNPLDYPWSSYKTRAVGTAEKLIDELPSL